MGEAQALCALYRGGLGGEERYRANRWESNDNTLRRT